MATDDDLADHEAGDRRGRGPRFYEHNGVDVRGIARALWAGRPPQGVVEGGSTITQQFVKNAYTATSRRSRGRSSEAALAWQLEQRWSKDRILTAYLNTIYFGNGAYGIQQAARTYFQQERRRPDARRVRAARRDPGRPVRCTTRSRNPSAAASAGGIVLADDARRRARSPQRAARARRRRAAAGARGHPAPGHARARAVLRQLRQDQLVAEYGAGRVFGGGLEVTTTIDLDLQEHGARGDREGAPTSRTGPPAALVAIDPRDGRRARDVRRPQLPREPVQPRRRRPSGSPAPRSSRSCSRRALSAGHLARRRGSSRSRSRSTLGDRIWKVTNYEETYLGTSTSSRAMVSSDNSVYAQLTDSSSARRRSSRRRSSSGSGAGSTATSRSASARSPSTRSTWRAPTRRSRTTAGASTARSSGNRPRVVRTSSSAARARCGRTSPSGKQVARRRAQAATLTSILENVVAAGHRQARRTSADRAVAGKTGTTETTATPGSSATRRELAVAVWVGYPDELRPMLTEFDGEPVAGRHASRADLEGVHREGARGRAIAAALHRRPVPPSTSRSGSSTATAAGGSTTATAAARRVVSTSPARAAEHDRRLQAERGARCRPSSGARVESAPRLALAAHAARRADVVYVPAEPRPAARLVVDQQFRGAAACSPRTTPCGSSCTTAPTGSSRTSSARASPAARRG